MYIFKFVIIFYSYLMKYDIIIGILRYEVSIKYQYIDLYIKLRIQIKSYKCSKFLKIADNVYVCNALPLIL